MRVPNTTVIDAGDLSDVEVLAEGLAFPEGPVALADGSVIVVEISAGLVTRIDPDRSKTVLAHLGGGPNGAAFGPDGALYVCNNGGMARETGITPGIQRLDMTTGTFETIYERCGAYALGAPNDIVFDRTGNFWFTDLDNDRIYYAAPDGSSITSKIGKLTSPNGIGLSPEEDVLYWAQTHTRQVLRRRIVAPGETGPSVGSNTSAMIVHGAVDRDAVMVGLAGMCEFDSLAIDGSGAVCVATLIDDAITVVSPDASRVEQYHLPERVADGAVTNICFGGPDLSTAYITLSGKGRLISCRWPRPGLRLNFSR